MLLGFMECKMCPSCATGTSSRRPPPLLSLIVLLSLTHAFAISLATCLFLCLCFCLSIYLPAVCLSVCLLSVCFLSARLSLCLTLPLSLSGSFTLSFHSTTLSAQMGEGGDEPDRAGARPAHAQRLFLLGNLHGLQGPPLRSDKEKLGCPLRRHDFLRRLGPELQGCGKPRRYLRRMPPGETGSMTNRDE